jgi:16S rRNA (cytosine1402-N4)-methyltransferase
MRLDDRLERTAADIVNTFDEKTLADIIYNYGQDRASRRIARFIVRSRLERRIETTGQLATIVCKASGQPGRGRRSRIHPATKTFQALRIAVNDELQALQELLAAGPTLLKRGGMIAVISFHSLEDRIVKTDFRENAARGIYEILTKKPIIASRDEIDRNPRTRSAKLRIARCKTN